MLRASLIGLITSAVLLGPAYAQRFELKPKKIKLTKTVTEVLPQLELRPKRNISEEIEEPKYKTLTPQKFITFFGVEDGVEVTFAGDERKGDGKGYSYLYADLEGEKNLKKGKKLSGKPERTGYASEVTTFPPFKVKLPAGEDETDYSVQAQLVVSRAGPSDKTLRDSTLYLTSLCCLEGNVQFGDEKQKMIVFDANCNGVFGERGSPGRKRGSPSGDRVWIGKGSPKLEEAYVEALPLGKYTLWDDAYYLIEVGADNFVEIQPADVPLGKVKVNNPGFLLELVSGEDILWVYNTDGDEMELPVGKYDLLTPCFRTKGKGGIWELEGEPQTVDIEFEVTEGATTEIEVGPTLKLVTQYQSRRSGTGLDLYIKFHIEGSQGERYRYLRKNGKKVDLPKISIVTEKGKEVKKGRFEYG